MYKHISILVLILYHYHHHLAVDVMVDCADVLTMVAPKNESVFFCSVGCFASQLSLSQLAPLMLGSGLVLIIVDCLPKFAIN